MRSGKFLPAAMGMACFLYCAGLAFGGESGDLYHDSIVSLRKNARVAIGGEILADFHHRRASTSMSDAGRDLRGSEFMLRTAILRLTADVHPNVGAVFKMNFNPDSESGHDREILEEALLVMKSVGGAGFGFTAGMGRAPYGQDVTLGMIQSYHHAANRTTSPEGTLFIVEPPDAAATPDEAAPVAPMRPGQLDRSVMAGVSYQWDERWRVEAAVFRADHSNYRPRLVDRGGRDRGGFDSDVGAAARVWVMPIDDLVVEASGVWLRSKDMGDMRLRTDVAAGARGSDDAFAVSVGFDWRRGPWMAFGEYQRGWDWNFTEGYDTHAWQFGAARKFGDWRPGAMIEGLRIDDRRGRKTLDDYYKLSLNIRYDFSPALFILAEYGREWFRREYGGRLAEKRRGDFFGVRLGFSF